MVLRERTYNWITILEVLLRATVLLTNNMILKNLKYIIAGTFFGIIAVKSEIISWFRIQEMFRLTSFHMYGVIGTAVVVGMISIQLIKQLNIKTLSGDKISIAPKIFNKGQIYGGLIFGFGWAITDRKSTRLNSSHRNTSRMPSSA